MLALALRFATIVFILVGLLHLVLGLHADIMLGAQLPAEAVNDPVLDSQNRFYGTAFMLYGVLLSLGARDLPRHAAMLQCCFWCFFAGGLARLVSWALHGPPSPMVVALLVTELLLPPLLSVWLSRAARDA